MKASENRRKVRDEYDDIEAPATRADLPIALTGPHAAAECDVADGVAPRQPGALRRATGLYPYVRQRDQTDCGAACLAMITAFYGNPIGLARLRDMADVDVNGATMWSIAQAAEHLGFHARGLLVGADALEHIQLPAVLHWEGNHYVVLYEVTKRHVVIADPGKGRRRMDMETFRAGYTKRALELVPSDRLSVIEGAPSAWKRFLPALRPHRRMLFEVLGASFLVSLLGLGLPLFTQVLIDRVLVNRSVDLLNMMLLGMVGIAVFHSLVKMVRQLILVHLSTVFDARLLSDFLRHVFSLPIRYFEVRTVGDIVSRVRENEEIRLALTSTLPSVCLDTVLATSYLAILASYDLELTLVVCAVIPAFAGIMLLFTPRIRRNEQACFEKQADASAYLIQSLNGIETLKAMAVERDVRWRLESMYVDTVVAARAAAHTSAAYSGLATLVQGVSAALFLWYGAHQVMTDSMTSGQLLAFVAIAGNVVTPILGLVTAWDKIQNARNAVNRLGDVFESEPEEPRGGAMGPPELVAGAIRFEDVSFSYRADPSECALQNIGLEIAAGDTVAIVGRSGSGKSTLLKLILGLYEPTAGSVTIDGQDLRTLSHSAIRRRSGVVPQNVFLFSGTVRENIALGHQNISSHEIVQAAKQAGAHDFISRLPNGYSTQIGERGTALSGGQRQMLALARALLRQPDLILLDEATAALDPIMERELQSRLTQACADRTTVIVAHRLSTIREVDQIVVIDQGRIVEQGTYEELVGANGSFTELVGDTFRD